MGARRPRSDRTPEAAFVEFRRTREPQPLSEVFDACAQELLLVAHHLAGRGVSPEDLLQSTFLEAISHADQFDGRRPLMPWLCGILVNVSRRHNREQRREYEAWRLDEIASEDPAELAHAREFAVELRRAIDAFPAPQREALTLRLVHGLTPTQIAHALGHPVGSVKSWVHRGVERLRHALPAGFATALAAIAQADTTLDALKLRLLEQACGPASAPVGASIARTAASARSPFWLGALALSVASIAVATWWRASHAPNSVRTLEQASGAPSTTAHATPTPGEQLTSSRQPTSRPNDAQRGATTARGATIHARFASDGAPAAITIRIEPRFGADPQLRSWTVRTDAAGLAHSPQMSEGEYLLTPDRAAPQIVFAPKVDGVVELEIPAGLALVGRVLDRHRAPVPGARVWLSHADELGEGEFATSTGSDGAFELRDVPAARAIAIVADGFEPSVLRSTATFGASNSEFVLERAAAPLSGTVREPGGQPIAGARVQLGRLLDPQWSLADVELHDVRPPLTTTTDEFGRFELASAGKNEGEWLFARASGRQLYAAPIGSERVLDLRLSAGRRWTGVLAGVGDEGHAVDLRVTPERPVADLRVRAPTWGAPSGRFGDGAFELGGLPHGRVVLSARENARLLGRRDGPADSDADLEWSPQLDGRATSTGVVRFESGAPFAGARVTLLDARGGAWTRVASELGEFEFDEAPAGPLTFVVRGPDETCDVALEPALELDPSAASLELVVRDRAAPVATLVATALDAQGRELDGLHLLRAFSYDPIDGRRRDDGRMEFGPLPTDDYYLLVSGPNGPLIAHGPVHVDHAGEFDCGEVRAPEAGRLSVRFEGLDDADRKTAYGTVTSADGVVSLTFFKLTGGAGMCLPIPAGRARLLVNFPAAGIVLHEVELLPGRTVELVLPRPTGVPVRLALIDHDPRPRLGARVDWLREGGGTALQLIDVYQRSRDDGARESLWNVEPGRYRVEALAWGVRSAFTEVEVSRDRGPQFVRVDLR